MHAIKGKKWENTSQPYKTAFTKIQASYFVLPSFCLEEGGAVAAAGRAAYGEQKTLPQCACVRGCVREWFGLHCTVGILPV